MQIIEFTDEQRSLQGVAREVLTKRSDSAAVRELTDGDQPFDRQLWSLGGELGWFLLEPAEELGGAGQTYLETSLMLREIGRATTPGPFLSQTLAVHALAASDSPARTEWLERLLTGESIGAVVIGTTARNGALRLGVDALGNAGAVTLTGVEHDVLDAGLADVLVVAARDADGGTVIAAVPAAAVTVTPKPLHDRTRRVYDVAFDGVDVPAEAVLARGPRAAELLGGLAARFATGIALDCVGGAAKVVEMTVEYTSQRVQYGRPIATFQAVKHTCADMYVESEVARVATDAAVLEIVADGPRRSYWSAVAKFRAGDAYAKIAGDSLQMHGGIGMTWEFGLHYWLKRAKLNQSLFGSSDAHRAVVATLV